MAMKVDLKVNGDVSQVCLSETDLSITRRGKEEEEQTQTIIALDDVVAVENSKSSTGNYGISASYSCVVHFITRYDNPKWSIEYITLTGTDDNCNGFQTFCTHLNLKFSNITTLRPKRLLVLMNAIGGKHQAQTVYDTVMNPIFELTKITCDLVVSQRPKHLTEVMTHYDCKDVDGIVMMGGDGTVAEIINVLIKKTQEEAGIDCNDPKAELKPILKPIGIISTGSVNVTAESLYGCQDVCTATLHVVKGKTKYASILGSYCENKLIGYCGCGFGLLYIATLLHIADRQLRWMRTARYTAAAFVHLAKKFHKAPIEVTVYSRENQRREDTEEAEEILVEKEETFTQDCCMVMIWPWFVGDKSNKICFNPQDSENQEDLFAFFFERFGKFEMFRMLLQRLIRQNIVDMNPKIKQVKGYALRIKFLGKGDRPAESDPRNLMVCIDGEVEHSPKADYFVKKIVDIVSAYCSR